MTQTIGIVIPAAGRGTRAGNGCLKAYRQIAGETVIARVVKAFRGWNPTCPIVIVHHVHDTSLLDVCIQHCKEGNVYTAIGGNTRQASVLAGLRFLGGLEQPPSHVFIHDAARPFVSHAVLDRVRGSILANPDMGVIPAIPVSDTLKATDANGVIERTVPREGLQRAQTPQAFPLRTIMDLHEAATGREYTDDASLFEQAGLAVRVVEGEERNVKLTYAEDFEDAERMLNADSHTFTQTNTAIRSGIPDIRVGHGYDTHKLIPGNEITLCGVKISNKATLLGHSDADVGLHALTNALLGTVCADDIGSHFSPSDARWKDASSDQFLRHAGSIVQDAGGILTHCDVSIVCERPKISPHRDAMRDSIAGILGIDRKRVSVKAGTNEKNGFIGREEGIVAFATATVIVP